MATAEEQDLAEARPMTFRLSRHGVRHTYAPGMLVARCPCWRRNSFPNRIVGAIEKERNWLNHDLNLSIIRIAQAEHKLTEANQALHQAQQEILELKEQLASQAVQKEFADEMMDYYREQNDHLRVKARDESMVVQEALVDMDLACGQLHRSATQLAGNPTTEEAKKIKVNVKHLHRLVRRELERVRMPSIAGPSQVELTNESINQAPNMNVAAGQGLEMGGLAGFGNFWKKKKEREKN